MSDLNKLAQEKFHALNAECDAHQADIQALQDEAATLVGTMEEIRELKKPIAAKIQEIAQVLLPKTKERSRLVKFLDGKTGQKPT